MSTIPTARQTAVGSINALKAMQKRAEALAANWGDIDGALVAEFGYLQDRLQTMIDEIAEVYPPRSNKGGAA